MNARRQILSLALLLAALGGVLVMMYLTVEPRRAPASATPRAPSTEREPVPPITPTARAAEVTSSGAIAPAREAIAPSPARHAVLSAIRGRVQDAAGNALPGAILDLREPAGHRVARGTSDAEGRFALEVPPATSASLLVRHADHAGVLMHEVRADAGELTVVLEPGFAVHGVITERDTQMPVPGAQVGFIPSDQPPEMTVSDSRGEYRFAHMRSGTAFVVVHAIGWEEVRRRFGITDSLDIELKPGTGYEGRVVDGVTRAPIEGAKLTWRWTGDSWLEQIWFLEPPSLPEVTRITDRWGRFAFDRIGLQTGAVYVVAKGYQPYLSSEFEPEIALFGPVVLRGVVIDPTERPVAGAKVELLGRKVAVTSDAQGRFELANLDPYGGLDLLAQHPDWAPARSGLLTLPLADPEIRLQLVWPGRISGEVRSAERRPVPDTAVILHNLDRDRPLPIRGSLGRPMEATTDAGGRFVYDRLTPGKYRVFARIDTTASAEVQVAAGQTVSITLDLPRSAMISGRCLDDQDRPLSGVAINNIDGQQFHLVQSDEQGNFAIGGFTEGKPIPLQAVHQGFVTTRFTAKAGDRDVIVRLGHGQTLRGIVRSRATREPIAGALLDLSPPAPGPYLRPSPAVHCVSAADGTFVASPLEPGTMTIVVRAPGHASLETEVTIGTEPAVVELSLEAAAVWGSVKHANGSPAAHVTVALLEDPSRARAKATTTSPEGDFAFANLAAGRMLVCVGDAKRPFVPLEPVAIDAASGSLRKTFTLPDPVTLTLTLRDGNGRPVPAGRVYLDSDDRGTSIHRESDVDDSGSVVIAGLCPGRYRLQTDCRPFAPVHTKCEIADWRNAEQTVTLARARD